MFQGYKVNHLCYSASLVATLGGVLAVLFLLSPAQAVDQTIPKVSPRESISLLSRTNAPVEHHGFHGTGVELPKNQNFKRYLNTKLRSNQRRNEADSIREQGVFSAMEIPKLPVCGSSRVTKVEVNTISMESVGLDYLVYDFSDAISKERAAGWDKLSIPYYPNKVNTQSADKVTPYLQAAVLMVGVRCLPTRVHIEGDAQSGFFLQYREGDRAWDK